MIEHQDELLQLRARVAVLEAALRQLVGYCEIAAVAPKAIGRPIVYAIDGPELNEARAALAKAPPR